MSQWAVFHGDALELLRTLPSESIDSIVTDPPYGLGNREPTVDELVEFLRGEGHLNTGGDFMGRQWKVPSVAAWKECLRVLKPGGHLLSFGGTRTFDLISLGLRAAGFEYRDTLQWLYGSGFPKSLDVSKQIDKHGGLRAREFKLYLAEIVRTSGLTRKEVDTRCNFTMRFDTLYEKDPVGWGVSLPSPEQWQVICSVFGNDPADWDEFLNAIWRGRAGAITSDNVSMSGPNYERCAKGTAIHAQAMCWSGWGTALKPSWEPILLFRKPLTSTVAENVLAHGTGALNIDGCRVGTDWNEPDRPASWAASGHSAKPEAEKIAAPPGIGMQLHPGGRWPTNAVFTHSASCRLVGSEVVKANGGSVSGATALGQGSGWNKHNNRPTPIHREDETVPVYDCAPDCPVRVLDQQSGILVSGKGNFKGASSKGYQPSVYSTDNRPEGQQQVAYGDTGTASRFFPRFEWSGEHDDPFLYSGKASTKEREAGCENIPPAESGRHNDHTTVKAVALMRWLVRLVTPPGGVCLDIFCGSGTTGVACVLEGFHFMGFEQDPRFVEISRARIAYWAGRRAA